MFVEFEEVPKRASNLDSSVAKMSANEARNRFKDILPYDSSRVKLAPKKDNPAGYINASHVKVINIIFIFLSRTEELAKAGTCACDRCVLQQRALNVHGKHSDLT